MKNIFLLFMCLIGAAVGLAFSWFIWSAITFIILNIFALFGFAIPMQDMLNISGLAGIVLSLFDIFIFRRSK